ncbi:MAG: hypothetical protein ACI9FJ_000560 [Alteromonadaceae bacterium]|jgi:hypothetical protein
MDDRRDYFLSLSEEQTSNMSADIQATIGW